MNSFSASVFCNGVNPVPTTLWGKCLLPFTYPSRSCRPRWLTVTHHKFTQDFVATPKCQISPRRLAQYGSSSRGGRASYPPRLRFGRPNCFVRLGPREASVLFSLEGCLNNDPGEERAGILAHFYRDLNVSRDLHPRLIYHAKRRLLRCIQRNRSRGDGKYMFSICLDWRPCRPDRILWCVRGSDLQYNAPGDIPGRPTGRKGRDRKVYLWILGQTEGLRKTRQEQRKHDSATKEGTRGVCRATTNPW